MIIKCNNVNCAYQYAGDCTARENIKLFIPAGGEEYITQCTAFCRKYVHYDGELESIKDRNVFCDRKDCKHIKKDIIYKCGLSKIKVITGVFGDNEARCMKYERKETDG